MHTDKPIEMHLFCPICHRKHIDMGEFATKPHHTHSCQFCGYTWRPSVVPTVGVEFLPRFKDEVDMSVVDYVIHTSKGDVPVTHERHITVNIRYTYDPSQDDCSIKDMKERKHKEDRTLGDLIEEWLCDDCDSHRYVMQEAVVSDTQQPACQKSEKSKSASTP